MPNTPPPVARDETIANASPFGRWLLNQLRDRGMTQAHLAKRMGTSRNTIYRYVSGRMNIDPDRCQVMAEALGIDPQEVMAAAGYLGKIDDTRQQLQELIRSLPEEFLDDARLYLNFLLQRPVSK